MLSSEPSPHANDIDLFLHHCKRSRYPAKCPLINIGDKGNRLYYLIKGSVSVIIEDEEGREIIVDYLNSGDFFGEIRLFDKQVNQCSAAVRTKIDSEIAEISYDKFHQLALSYPGLLLILCSQMAHRLRNTTRKMGNLAFLDVAGRVAATLVDLCRQPDAISHTNGTQIKITRQEIGRIVGCSREMAGRVLKDFEEQGLVSVSGKKIVVFDTNSPA